MPNDSQQGTIAFFASHLRSGGLIYREPWRQARIEADIPTRIAIGLDDDECFVLHREYSDCVEDEPFFMTLEDALANDYRVYTEGEV